MGDCGYLLDVRHSGFSGFIITLIATSGILVNLLLTCVFTLFKFPRLSVSQTRRLMTKTRRNIYLVFLASLIPFDFFAVHAWRFLPGEAACIPKSDWVMVWIFASVMGIVNMMIAVVHRPYTLVMLHTNNVFYSVGVLYYMFSTISDNYLCGSLLVALPTLIVGVISMYMVPDYLTLMFRSESTDTEVYDESLRMVGMVREGVSGDQGSVSAYIDPGSVGAFPMSTEESVAPRTEKIRRRRRRHKEDGYKTVEMKEIQGEDASGTSETEEDSEDGYFTA